MPNLRGSYFSLGHLVQYPSRPGHCETLSEIIALMYVMYSAFIGTSSVSKAYSLSAVSCLSRDKLLHFRLGQLKVTKGPYCDLALSGKSKGFPIAFPATWASLSGRLPPAATRGNCTLGARITRQAKHKLRYKGKKMKPRPLSFLREKKVVIMRALKAPDLFDRMYYGIYVSPSERPSSFFCWILSQTLGLL